MLVSFLFRRNSRFDPDYLAPLGAHVPSPTSILLDPTVPDDSEPTDGVGSRSSVGNQFHVHVDRLSRPNPPDHVSTGISENIWPLQTVLSRFVLDYR
ncbi:hypothetical protein Trydic_g12103 [Trypoxylus dichotomus]